MTTPTRSSPTATRRSTSAPTATRRSTPSAPRPTPTTCAARSCGSRRRPAAATRSRAGNLFAPGTPKTRPEIYAMGWRNPFRIEIDPDTDDIYVADYSPDAGDGQPRTAAPPATASGRSMDKPGNYGWPYCATAELPYNDFDFATRTSRREVQLRRPGQRLPPQHRPARAAAGGAAGGLVLVRRLARVPGARDRRHRPDGRPGVPVRQEGHQGSQPGRLAAALRRHPAVLRVDA